ncbi:FAD-dependent oxidoreductase [bacterium]|jgi:thioredoxin reductase (NADPH)|nr:FAD-dependent oxidoreductase [bacterium]MBT5015818.1 FAD-dependent oxidoreductase [bacterium]
MAKGINYGLTVAFILVVVFIPVFFYKKSFCCSAYGTGDKSGHSFSIHGMKDVRNIAPVLIIGSGPAGLTAALYSARLGFPTYILDGAQPGGQLTTTSYIENWPSREKILGTELMDAMRKQVMSYDVTFLNEDASSVDLTQWPYTVKTSDGTQINALSVIICTGSKPILLGVPGETEFWSKGVSTCAVCDAAFYKDKHVIVVGGGDSAAEQALQLAVYAKKVDLIVRKDAMRASQAMQEELKKLPRVSVLYNNQVKKVKGTSAHVTSVDLYDSKSDTMTDFPVDGVFLAIGSKPNTQMFTGQLRLNEGGYIEVQGHSQRTSVEGVAAAGDVEDAVYKQAIVAAGEGSKAAIDTQHFLQKVGLGPDALDKVSSQFFIKKKPIMQVEIDSISTIEEFEKEVANSDVPVVLDFYTPSCASCKYMLPFYQEAAQQLEGRVKLLKVNAEKAKDLATKLVVVKVPAFLVYKGGKLVARYQKVMNKSKMVEFISQFADDQTATID